MKPRKERQVNRETQQVKGELMQYLKRFKRQIAQDFVKVCKHGNNRFMRVLPENKLCSSFPNADKT